MWYPTSILYWYIYDVIGNYEVYIWRNVYVYVMYSTTVCLQYTINVRLSRLWYDHIPRDIMSELGLIIDYRTNVIDCEDIQIPMTSNIHWPETIKSIDTEYWRTSNYN